MLSFRGLITKSNPCARLRHTLPSLDYDYGALEPNIDEVTMCTHHTKHHQGYVNNLNSVERELYCALKEGRVGKAISLLPKFRFHGGGHINHSFFWKSLSPCSDKISREFCAAICKEWGSMVKFMEKFKQQTIDWPNAGWSWLAYDKKEGHLLLTCTKAQNPLEATTGYIPILAVDVWEHSYYLKYKQDRGCYFDNIRTKFNWGFASKQYAKCTCP